MVSPCCRDLIEKEAENGRGPNTKPSEYPVSTFESRGGAVGSARMSKAQAILDMLIIYES